MKTKQRVMMAALALCLMALLQTTAQADPVSLTINPPTQSGSAGSVLMFSGTFANLGPPSVLITGGFGNFVNAGVVGLTINTSGFENNFLGMTVANGGSLTNLLFTVTVGNSAVPGTYQGVFTILFDGATAGQEIVQTFSVTVLQGPNPIPEPATMFLFGSGLAGLAAARRRRRKQQPQQK